MSVVSIDLKAAHEASINNRVQIEKSILCGCFECCATFDPIIIKEWTDNGQTARCPVCPIPMGTVIGNASGMTLNKAFLQRLHQGFMRP